MPCDEALDIETQSNQCPWETENNQVYCLTQDLQGVYQPPRGLELAEVAFTINALSDGLDTTK
jgi:hypothetical protein